MNVRLISSSAARAPELQGLGPEAAIIYIARVSSSREDKTEDLPGLIGYLIRNKHWSPFEMASMCVGIETSRAISLQIVRHRSFSYQQFSQRYAASADMEPIELRWQAQKNRQSSTDVVDLPELQKDVDAHLLACQALYESLIDQGVAKESARFVLPATTQTKLYMNGTVRSWIHYLEIRDDEHVQKEHRDIAIAIKKIFMEQYPLTSEALGWTKPQES